MKGEENECSATVYSLPRSHWHCRLDNFKYENPLQEQAVAKFINQCRAVARFDYAPHLLLTGPPGTGKTHLSVALYRLGVFVEGTGACLWRHFPTFCDQVYANWRMKERGGFDAVDGARHLVVFDDVFARRLRQVELEDILFRSLEIAYLNRAAIIITDNAPVKEWKNWLTQHKLSRLLEGAIPVKFEGLDKRLLKDDA